MDEGEYEGIAQQRAAPTPATKQPPSVSARTTFCSTLCSRLWSWAASVIETN